MIRIAATLLLLAGAAFGQPRLLNSYTATCVLSLSSSSKACTLQQPATGARTVQLVSAYVHSTAAISITQERDGTAASATAATEVAVNPSETATATVTAFTDSNVGVGTVIAGTDSVKIAANSAVVLDLEDIQMRGNGTGKNYSIRTSSGTATVTVVLKWREY